MPKSSEVIDITGYPLLPLEKSADGKYPFPRTRYGILPWYINEQGQILWGCIESNRIEPVTLAPAAGTQDIIAIKDGLRLVLEAGKPLPDLDIPGWTKGERFRDDVYQATIERLVDRGFDVYLENPLATAIHEAYEEHGINVCDRRLLTRQLESLLPMITPEHTDVAALCVWFPELDRTHIDSINLRYTEKIDTKMRRNSGRQFYEKGCWVTLADFRARYTGEKEKFSSLALSGYAPVKITLINETFKAFDIYRQLLESIESSLLPARQSAVQDQAGRVDTESCDTPRQEYARHHAHPIWRRQDYAGEQIAACSARNGQSSLEPDKSNQFQR